MGIALTKVARNALIAKQTATTTLVRPVRPPAPIPEALSTKVVVLEVPKIAPMEVAVASANSALSILDLKPELVSIAFSSSSLKMPARRPVPMKVPMVSKVSEMLKEKMVMSTRGSFAISVNRDGRPCAVKIAPKVVGSAAQASVKLIGVTRSGNAHRNADDGRHNDADQDCALYVADKKNNRQNQADQEQPEHRLIQRGDSRNAGIKSDDAHIQKADISNKDADAAADGVLQALGIDLMMYLRSLVTVIRMLINPQMNTMDSACCQVKPRPKQTV